MAQLPALTYGLLLFLGTGWLLHVGRDVLVPVFIGAVIAFIVSGLAQGMAQLPLLKRAAPLRVRYLVSMVLIGAGFALLTYAAVANRDLALAQAPRFQAAVLNAIQKGAVQLGIENEPTWATLRRDLFADVSLQRMLGSVLTSGTSILATFALVTMYAAFLLVERGALDGKLARLFPDAARVARVRDVLATINRRVGSYLALKTLLGVLLGVLCALAMSLFGLQFAWGWGVLIGVLNYVPYLGSFIGVLLPALAAIVQFNDFGLVLALIAILIVVQFVIGNVLDPYLMANSLNLSPFAILLALAAWFELWGVAGAFLAVPITAVMTIVMSEFASTRGIAVLLSRSGDV
jgi:AI-2 transport protein TqsA